MRDNPLIQPVFEDFARLMEPVRLHSVGGVASDLDQDAAIRRVALLNDATPGEVKRWLKEAGKL